MNRILIFLLILLSFNVCNGQNFNRPVTDEIFPYEFQLIDSTLDFYYAIGMHKISSVPSSPGYIQPKAMILDPSGYNVWYGAGTGSRTVTDFKYDSVSDQFMIIERLSGIGTPTIIDTNFNISSQFSVVNSSYLDPHDFIRLSDGNYVMLGIKDSTFDLSGYLFDGIPGNPVSICRCNMIEIVDPNNNLIWEWNTCDYIHPSEGYEHYGYDDGGYDYAHFNSVYEDDDGHLIVSFRHLDSVVKINRNTSDIMWQLGGKSSDFAFSNDVGFSGQHNAERRPSGNISVLDNGNMSGSPEQSRAVEYSIDTSTWTATLVDEYIHSPSLYGHATGSYYRWNNSKVIDFGRVQRPDPSIVVADELNQIQALAYFKDSVMSYRVQPFLPKFTFDRPNVSCVDSLGSTYLVAEPGHAEYLWSTGETTQSIEPMADSVYQVWVPQGIGKISSPPVHYSENYCSPIGISELNIGPSKLLRTIDLLGREIKTKKSGQVYIEIYDDGHIQKKVFLSEY
ncbi:MAG: aryl-sulfate sulfotransferase [Flavobacteriales bacterium]|nr:aryl-sulfate sulfotransferase [Flavobacteriales bacterium]